MPKPPTSVEDFLQTLHKSNLVRADQLEQLLKDWQTQSSPPSDPKEMADRLVQSGIITSFHAQNLLKGRYRGFTVGRYRVLEPIGSGGMGMVYLCEHLTMNHRVAMKVLPSKNMSDPLSVERFFREARAAAALNHPNLVRAHDIDRQENFFYLIMDYVEGVSLQDLVSRVGRLSPVRATHYIAQAALGLQHIHDSGLIHRDIKPGNLLLDRSGTVKILDLGLARYADDSQDKITKKYDEKSIIGTADYISPEQAMESSNVDHRADIYSLGATFYFLLARRSPFEGATTVQKLLYHQMKEPVPIHEVNPDVPLEMCAVLQKMMAKEPGNRFGHAIEIVEALQTWTREDIPAPADDEFPSRLITGPKSSGSVGGNTTVRSGVRLPMPGSTVASRRPSSGSSSSISATPRPPKPVSRTWVYLGGIALGLAIAVAVLFVLDPFGLTSPSDISSNDSKPGGSGVVNKDTNKGTETKKEEPPLPVEGQGIFLVRSGEKEVEVASLKEAMEKAKADQRIQVRKTKIFEAIRMPEGRAIVLEGRHPLPGKKVIWEAPADAGPETILLSISNGAKSSISGFAFDGKGKSQSLVRVSGKSTNLKIDDCEFRDFAGSGIVCSMVEGEVSSEVNLQNLRFTTVRSTPSAIRFAGGLNKLVAVSDCILEGPFLSAMAIASPLDQVRIYRNRFYQNEHGISLLRRDPAPNHQVTIENNTFYLNSSGLNVEQVPTPTSKCIFQNNLFVKVKNTSNMDGVQLQPAQSDANWIWFKDPEILMQKGAPPGIRFFRKTFTLTTLPPMATLNIGGDDTFTVWINGTEVGSSLGKYFARRIYAFEVGKLLKTGANTIAVKVTNERDPLNAGVNTAGGLMVDLMDKAKKSLVGTDASWKTFNMETAGWEKTEFSDTSWDEPHVWPLEGNFPWKNSVWQSVIEEQKPGLGRPTWLVSQGNFRCYDTQEGCPHLDTIRGFVKDTDKGRDLVIDPASPTFLKYDRNHRLNKAGSDGGPVGVSPD